MRYPQFTGTEPCTEIGTEVFFPSIDEPVKSFNLDQAKGVCTGCPSIEPCFQYALQHNVVGVWGGTTYAERNRMRKEMNIHPIPVVP